MEAIGRLSIRPPSHFPAFAECFSTHEENSRQNGDGRKTGNRDRMTATGSTSPDASRTADRGDQRSRNEARDRCLLLLMFRHGLRVGGLPDETRPGGHRSRVLHVARLKVVIDDAATARRRAAGRPRMAQRTRTHETDRQGVLCERAAKAVAPVHSQPACENTAPPFPCPARPSAHAAPRLRLRPGDQGADTRLIQDYLGHRSIQQTVKYTATNSARLKSSGADFS